jgi:hypothetical protein
MLIPYHKHKNLDKKTKEDLEKKGHILLPEIKIKNGKSVKLKFIKKVMSSVSSTEWECPACKSDDTRLNYTCVKNPSECSAYNIECKQCGYTRNYDICKCDEGYTSTPAAH